MNSTDKFEMFMAKKGHTFINEMLRGLENGAKPSSPNIGNNGATNITTPQAAPQQVHEPDILLEKFDTNGTDETNEMTQPRDESVKPPTESNSVKMQSDKKQ